MSATATVAFAATVRSEWTKLRTSRATMLTAMAAALVTLVITALHCANAPRGGIDAVGASLFGITVSQFVAGVCGVLAVTNEYSSATMSISLVATPRRGQLFAAKTALLATTALGYGTLTAATSFTLGRVMLGTPHAETGDPIVTLRRIAGAAAVLTAISLLGLACGYLARHSAGAILAVLALLVLPKLLGDALPTVARGHVLRYMPLSAADSLVSLPDPTTLAPLTALAVIAVQVTALLALAGAAFACRDA